MSINISFGGATITRPGAYSTVDTAGMIPVTLGSLKVLAFVGPLGNSATATVGTVVYFNDPRLAAEAIGEGDMLDAMRVAWRHGADLIAVSPAGVTAPATAPSDTEWQDAVDALSTEFVSGIVPISTDAAIHAKVDVHVESMSGTINRRRRRGFYGHETGLDATAVAALSTAIPTERGLLVTPCPLVANTAGVKTAKPGYFMAAAIAGLWAGQASQEPITYKNVKFDGLQTIYTAPQITALLDAHICPVEFVKDVGFRIVQGVTLAASEDLTEVELSVSTLKDDMSDNIERYFEAKYVGKAGVAFVERTIYNDLITILEGFISQGWISSYVPESVVVSRNGTAFYLSWEGVPTLPINNFLITTHLKLA